MEPPAPQPRLRAIYCSQPHTAFSRGRITNWLTCGAPARRNSRTSPASNAIRNSISKDCSAISPPPTSRWSNSINRCRRKSRRLRSTTQHRPRWRATEFVVAGYGVTVRGDGRTGGTVRAATLIATGTPNTLQLRLFDPRTKGDSPGLGACAGDSGAPAFRDHDGTLAIVGVVSWSTGPKLTGGCGGLTGITPLIRYRSWIITAAQNARFTASRTMTLDAMSSPLLDSRIVRMILQYA